MSMLGAVVEPRARRDEEHEVGVDHPSKALHADSTMNSCGGNALSKHRNCGSAREAGSHPRHPQVVSRLGLGLVVVVHRDGDFVSPYRDDLAVERRERAVDLILRGGVQPNPLRRGAGVTCTEVNPFSLSRKSLVRVSISVIGLCAKRWPTSCLMMSRSSGPNSRLMETSV